MNTIAVKGVIAWFLYHTGITRRLSRGFKNSMIIAYHHVVPEYDDAISFLQPGMYVTTKTFEKHLQYLRKNYHIIPLDKIDGVHIENACVITFDDGWADNFNHALPILRKYDAPATIFLSTGFMDSYEWPWPDRVSYYAAYAPETGFTEMLRYLGHETGASLPSGDMTDLRRSVAAEMCIARMKREPHARLTEIMGHLDALFKQQHEDLNTRRPWLTWDEVGEMDQAGISFGAHTHNHVILTSCNPEKAEQEIVTSKDMLSERIGRPVRMFSFPNGDYHEKHVDVLKCHGFTHAVTTRSGVIRSSEDLLTLRRFMLHDDMTKTIPMLACKLAGSIPYF